MQNKKNQNVGEANTGNKKQVIEDENDYTQSFKKHGSTLASGWV